MYTGVCAGLWALNVLAANRQSHLPDRLQGKQRIANRLVLQRVLVQGVPQRTIISNVASNQRQTDRGSAGVDRDHTSTSKAFCHCCCCQRKVACFCAAVVGKSSAISNPLPFKLVSSLSACAACCLTSPSTACHVDTGINDYCLICLTCLLAATSSSVKGTLGTQSSRRHGRAASRTTP